MFVYALWCVVSSEQTDGAHSRVWWCRHANIEESKKDEYKSLVYSLIAFLVCAWLCVHKHEYEMKRINLTYFKGTCIVFYKDFYPVLAGHDIYTNRKIITSIWTETEQTIYKLYTKSKEICVRHSVLLQRLHWFEPRNCEAYWLTLSVCALLDKTNTTALMKGMAAVFGFWLHCNIKTSTYPLLKGTHTHCALLEILCDSAQLSVAGNWVAPPCCYVPCLAWQLPCFAS